MEKSSENYRSWVIASKSREAAGRLVAERVCGNTWRIGGMRVYPERRGYGTLLFKHAMKKLREAGCDKLETYVTSKQAIGFFAKHGFIHNEGDYEPSLVLHI